MRILLKNGHVIDPGRFDGPMDVWVEDGKVGAVDAPGALAGREPEADRVVDAAGRLVTPGLVDMHVHLREPGFEYKETIESGCRAAAAGGFTAVACMPNTKPVNDCAQITRFIIDRAAEAGLARVFPVAAVSLNLEGKTLSEFGELQQAGAVAVTDDGLPVKNSQLMRRALEYAGGFGLPVISHSEDPELAAHGAMNEGETATRLGLPGIPNAAESVMVMRDIALAELTGQRVHIAHVSTRESVRAIREAKSRGVPVTAETAPHYFTLTDAAVGYYDTNAKMNPPLRAAADVEAIRQGLADGTLDAIATDHAPHAVTDKDVEFEYAANGVIGLETSLPVSLRLVTDKVLTLSELIAKMTVNPAGILNIPCGLKEGAPADITVIDMETPYTIRAESFASLSRNTPFEGYSVKGRAVLTIVGGRIVHEAS